MDSQPPPGCLSICPFCPGKPLWHCWPASLFRWRLVYVWAHCTLQPTFEPNLEGWHALGTLAQRLLQCIALHLADSEQELWCLAQPCCINTHSFSAIFLSCPVSSQICDKHCGCGFPLLCMCVCWAWMCEFSPVLLSLFPANQFSFLFLTSLHPKNLHPS